jgi:hypothetical protein
MDALTKLERKFNIKITKSDSISIRIPDHKSQSAEWSNLPRLLQMVEIKLRRNRDKCGYTDFVKYCRVIDHVTWDYEHNNMKPTKEMIEVLNKLIYKLNNAEILNV